MIECCQIGAGVIFSESESLLIDQKYVDVEVFVQENSPVHIIENLKKVSLSLEAGTSSDHMNITPRPTEFEFVFGLGTLGLTPFEFTLADKTCGDEILVQLRQEDLQRYFEHISLPIFRYTKDHESFYLKARVINISQVDSKELLKAMAHIANCGDSCCGHH